MSIKEIIAHFESFAPLSLQESYDNAGLAVGLGSWAVKSIVLTIDFTEEVIDEAIHIGANLIISHHPLIFNPIRKINASNYIERIIIKAIKHDIALYSAHTNLDKNTFGVNKKICDKLNLINCKILAPVKGELQKLVTFVPKSHIEKVREAVFSTGAGFIGNYENCSFNTEGTGTFKGNAETNPFVGKAGILHNEPEIRFETIFPKYIQKQVISTLLQAHPYEEVAYDIFQLENEFAKIGDGMIGYLQQPETEIEFLKRLKNTFDIKVIKHSAFLNKPIEKVAVCGGAGSFLMKQAIYQQADIFITGDVKYHQYFDTENKILLADIGHFESEQYTKEIFYEVLTKKFPNIAVHFSKINTNPIKYF